ncbi:trace amine-associated receptor 9-like isoform X2 [Convolutriloba macropyga]|uniref:trace amine-associated receptor 9-like isoform X2 n=1 Tax=Convolutriloba macropyga TaxID=536237 RepID=UPI003F52834D
MASNGVCASTEPPDLYWVMAALLSSLTIFGNIVVFGLNFTRSVPQNSTNFIITNLATIDLCIGLWIALLKCLPRLPMPPNGNSFALNVFCRFYCSDYPLWALLNASVFNLLLVTADRYLSVITPFFYKTTFSQQANLLGCVALTWVLGAVSVSYTTVAWTPSGVNSCVIDSSLPPTMLLWGGCWTLFGRFLLPTVLMVMAYAHISYCLSRMPEESQGLEPAVHYQVVRLMGSEELSNDGERYII